MTPPTNTALTRATVAVACGHPTLTRTDQQEA